MNDSLETRYAGAVDNLFTALKYTYPDEKDITLLEVDFNIDLSFRHFLYAYFKIQTV